MREATDKRDFLEDSLRVIARTEAPGEYRQLLYTVQTYLFNISSCASFGATLNDALLAVKEQGVDGSAVTQPKVEKQSVRLPFFLVNAINGATSFNVLDLIFDIRIGLSTPVIKVFEKEHPLIGQDIKALVAASATLQKVQVAQDKFCEQLREFCLNYIKFLNDWSPDGIDTYDRMSMALTNGEFDKRQVLFGVPFSYNMLMESFHSVHRELDVLDTVDATDLITLKKTGQLFCNYLRDKNITPLEPGNVRLPVGTSQGLLLKTRRDTPFFRGFSKFLLSLLASKCDSYDDLMNTIEKIGSPFSDRGFYNPYRDAFLGLRRMHMKSGKQEPLFRKKELIGHVKKSQGRIRAIFPFSEALKFWYKRLADPVKKHLFTQEGCFSVDAKIILKSQLLTYNIAKRSESLLKYERTEGEWLPHYDLSAYDSSTSFYLNQIYNDIMRGLSGEYSRLWGDAHNDSGVLHLTEVNHFSENGKVGEYLYLDDVNGRSTLSGQADVTLKNNVIHFVIVASFLVRRYSLTDAQSSVLIRDLITKGQTTLDGQLIILHLHGDDVFFYFSDTSEDYIEFQRYATSLGIKTGAESGPVYLKKIPTKDGSSLVGIPGSLFKNRLGEYAQKNWMTLALSLIDNETSEKWDVLPVPNSIVLNRRNLFQKEKECCRTVASWFNYSESTGGLVNGSNVINDKLTLSQWMAELINYNQPKAVQIRGALKANLYKTGSKQDDAIAIIKLLESDASEEDTEIMTNDEIADIFNSYSLSSYSGDGKDDFNIINRVHGLSRTQLLKLAQSLQTMIIDGNGICPSNENISQIVDEISVSNT